MKRQRYLGTGILQRGAQDGEDHQYPKHSTSNQDTITGSSTMFRCSNDGNARKTDIVNFSYNHHQINTHFNVQHQQQHPNDKRRKYSGMLLHNHDNDVSSCNNSMHRLVEDPNQHDSVANNAFALYAMRYNNVRPTYTLEGKNDPASRIPERLYPSPSRYNWVFTGSHSSGATMGEEVEYYEKDSKYGKVLLDFYYKTGTVRVLLLHPTHGEIQLFQKGRSLLPDIYRNILDDPIHNTDTKYRRRGTIAFEKMIFSDINHDK